MSPICPRSLLLALLALALTGCGTAVNGSPIPAAGFGDDNDAPRVPGATADTPRIPLPRRAAIDPCTLFTPADLAPVGGPIGPPRSGNPIPGTCAQLLGGAPENTAAAGFSDPYRTAVSRQPRGVTVGVEGYSSWLFCEPVTDYQTCTAATAIAPDHTLLTMLSTRGASAADTAQRLFGLTKAALAKLPPE